MYFCWLVFSTRTRCYDYWNGGSVNYIKYDGNERDVRLSKNTDKWPKGVLSVVFFRLLYGFRMQIIK